MTQGRSLGRRNDSPSGGSQFLLSRFETQRASKNWGQESHLQKNQELMELLTLMSVIRRQEYRTVTTVVFGESLPSSFILRRPQSKSLGGDRRAGCSLGIATLTIERR